MNIDGIHLVLVTTDDREHQLWAAATSRDEAVNRVLDAVPEGWAAKLLDAPMKALERASVNISPGEVCDLSGR